MTNNDITDRSGPRTVSGVIQRANADDMPAWPGQRPQLLFLVEVEGTAVLTLLETPGLLDTLMLQGYGVVLRLSRFDDADVVAAVRLLNSRGITLIARLVLPEYDGVFNAQNYPQALEHYAAFVAWARLHRLTFDGVGLLLAPFDDLLIPGRPVLPQLWQRLRLAGANVLYSAARDAYTDLVALIHQDGYDVHTYQVPLIADDRRAGTTLLQRMFDIIDLPSDLDVLLCSSSLAVGQHHRDLGGALIAAYGSAADAIAIGGVGDDTTSPYSGDGLPWEAVRRDLLLAAQHTDTICVATLEGCVQHGMLSSIVGLDWRATARPVARQWWQLSAARSLLLSMLLAGRYGPRTLGWLGWLLAIIFWFRLRRAQPGE